MKHFLFTIIASLIFSIYGYSQGLNINLVGELSYNQSLSDVWAWTDLEGKEYALVGVYNGLSIVDVSNPSNPVEVQFIPGANSIWRDMKTYNGYAYITNESDFGMLIVNLNELPNASFVNYTANDYFSTAHNIYIDEFGCAYVTGADAANGGVIFFDLNANPIAPPIIGEYIDNYVHDCYARNNILYTAEVYNGWFRVIDVTTKENPVVIGQQETSSTFTHNIWPSDDGTIVFTTDEVSSAYIDAYDISDLNNIIQLDIVQSNSGSGVIPHNAHVLNDFVVTSYYRDGVTIHDGSHPEILVEVGNYDTSPLAGNGFNGCWGVTPFLPSGLILATDIEEGLFVLQPEYIRASILDGSAFNSADGTTLNNVSVEILTTGISTATGFDGTYATGITQTGSFDIKFSKPGFEDEVINNVLLASGVVQTVSASLTPQQPFNFTSVVTNLSGQELEGISVIISNSFSNDEVLTDTDGSFNISNFDAGVYDVTVGAWGYVTQSFEDVIIDSLTYLVVELEEGYYDDFSLDFGWITYDEASSGEWVIGEPIGTSFNSTQANPDFDVDTDLGDQCFITGNGGGSWGTDDVDDGFVRLTSPEFDPTDLYNPSLNYDIWFMNGGGQGSVPDDYLTVQLTNGSDTIILEDLVDNANFWDSKSFLLDSVGLTLTSTMRLILTCADVNDGHIVEGGLDHFSVTGETVISVIENTSSDLQMLFSSNPFVNNVNIRIINNNNNDLKAAVYSLNGKLVDQFDIISNEFNWGNNIESGFYVLRLIADNKIIGSSKIIKLK